MLNSMFKMSKAKLEVSNLNFFFFLIERIPLSCLVEPQWPLITEINLLDYKHTKFSWLISPQIKPEKGKERGVKNAYSYHFKLQSYISC